MAKRKSATMEVLSETVGEERTESFLEEVPAQITAIVEYSPTAAALSKLKAQYQNVVYDVATVKGMGDAVKARAEVRTWRIGLEKKRVEIKAPALDRCRLIDTEAKRITAELEALEKPIDEQIKAEEGRKEAEKLAKVEAERLRVEKIQQKIDSIRTIPLTLSGKSADEIKTVLDKINDLPITTDVFQEYQSVALLAFQEAVATVTKLNADAVAVEEEKARIIAERAELEKLRKEQAEREAEAEKKRIAEEAKLKAEREAEEKKLKAEREAEEKRIAEARKIEDARIAEERVKEETRVAELRKAEEEKREKAEAKIAAEKERQRIETEAHEAKMKAERDEAERKRKEIEVQVVEVERQRVENERQKALAEEQAKKAAEHLEDLRNARRGTQGAALADILALARDEEGNPNCFLVRVEIALIAEANINRESAS